MTDSDVQLGVRLGRLCLDNPVMVASGTFGYAREMESLVDLSRLGAILPKTITWEPRRGNPPPRTVETSGGMLNSIGLDNDGIEAFCESTMPNLAELKTPIVVSIAGRSQKEFVAMANRLDTVAGIAAFELNISCPNVSGGIDFGTEPDTCERLIAAVRDATDLPILVKLTPNVTDITVIAQAAEAGGADALSLINTLQAMAIDWRAQRPRLGNVIGGLSGPAIKPVALRMVYQVARAVRIPVIGIGGIASIDDCMEFLVAGATAIQIGTANFYKPTISTDILDALPSALAELGTTRITEILGTLNTTVR